MADLFEQVAALTDGLTGNVSDGFNLSPTSAAEQLLQYRPAPAPVEPAVQPQAELQTFKTEDEVERARQLLLNNPTQMVPQIDQLFGEGASIQILQKNYQIPEPEEEAGFFGNLLQGTQNVLSAGVRGSLNAGAEMRQTFENLGSINNAQFTEMVDVKAAEIEAARGTPLTSAERSELELTESMAFRNTWSLKNPLMNAKIGDPEELPDYNADTVLEGLATVGIAGQTVDLQSALGAPNTVVGSLVEGMSQFFTSYAMLGGGGGVIRGLFAGGAADAVAFDPLDANISTYFDSTEQEWLKKYIPQSLVKDADDTEWEARMKSSVEGGILGTLIEGPIAIIKLSRGLKRARAERAANGSVSEQTLTELEELEETIQSFSDLSANGKPRGSMTPDGMFTTPDGMKFDPAQAGNRRLDLEIPKAEEPRYSLYDLDDQVPPKAPEADVAPRVETGNAPKPEVTTTAPTAPVAPSAMVGNSAMFKAALRGANETNEIVPISALDLEGNDIGLFNWDNMDGPVDAMQIMDSTQQALADSGALSARGLGEKQTLDSVYNQAVDDVEGMIGGNADDIRATFLDAERVTRDSAQRIVSGKMLLQSTGRRITELADTITRAAKNKDTNTTMERQLINLMTLHTDVQASVKGIQTATARAVGAGRIQTADALDDVALDALAQFGGSKQVQKLAKKIAAAKGNPKAQANIMRRAGENKFWGVLNEVWLNSMLSGPRTHILNLGANSFNMLLRPAIRGIGGALTGNTQAMEEGARQYVYLIGEAMESIQYLATVGRTQKDGSMANAFKAFYNSESVLDTATKFDFELGGNKRAISAGDGNVLGNGLVKGSVNALGKFATTSNRALTAEDELFKQIIFRSRMRAMVTTQAHRLDAKALKDMGYKDAKDYISGEMGKAINSKEILAERWQKMVASGQVLDDLATKEAFISKHLGSYNHTSKSATEALSDAREGTFTTPLRNGTFTSDMQKLIARNPWMRQLMPFVQTPTNILRTSFERMPILNLAMKRQRELLKNGTPDEKAIIAGNMAVGTAFAVTAFNFAQNGKITGGGPSYSAESDQAKLWNASPEWQPYSVNIGTDEKPNWFELKRLDPHGMIFGIVGDVNEMLEYMGDDNDDEVNNLVAMIAASFANNVMSKTYMMSVSDTMKLMDGSSNGDKFKNFADYRLASFIPYSSFSYQMNQNENEVMTELRTTTDRIRSRIWGMDESTPKHDWLTGEAVATPDYALGFIRQKKLDKEGNITAEVYEELRNLEHGFVGPQRTMGDIELNAVQFQRYNQLVGTLEVRGGTLIENIHKVITGSRYEDARRSAEINNPRSSDDPRVQQINVQIQIARKRAEAALLNEYPELREAFNSNSRNRKLIQAGRDADPLITRVD
jgi:hypothetical protein